MIDSTAGDSMSTGVTEENVSDAMAKVLAQGGFGVVDEHGHPLVDPAPPAEEDRQDPATPVEAPAAGELEPPQGEVTEPVTEPTQSAQFLTLADGRVLSLEDAERFAEFESTVMQDPRFIQAYEQVFGAVGDTQTEQPPPATPTAPTTGAPQATELPDEIREELEVNPVAKMLWDRLQAQEKFIADQFESVNTRTAAQQEAIDNYQRNNATTLVNQAKLNFQKEHSLTPQETQRVFDIMVNTYDMNKIVSLPTNPFTGNMETPDPVRRMEQALNASYLAIPEYFEREQSARVEAARQDAERKAKISSLSSGTSSPPPPVPVDTKDPASRRSALIADIAAAQSGNFIQPE